MQRGLLHDITAGLFLFIPTTSAASVHPARHIHPPPSRAPKPQDLPEVTVPWAPGCWDCDHMAPACLLHDCTLGTTMSSVSRVQVSTLLHGPLAHVQPAWPLTPPRSFWAKKEVIAAPLSCCSGQLHVTQRLTYILKGKHKWEELNSPFFSPHIPRHFSPQPDSDLPKIKDDLEEKRMSWEYEKRRPGKVSISSYKYPFSFEISPLFSLQMGQTHDHTKMVGLSHLFGITREGAGSQGLPAPRLKPLKFRGWSQTAKERCHR